LHYALGFCFAHIQKYASIIEQEEAEIAEKYSSLLVQAPRRSALFLFCIFTL